jgi:uncharacterized coiled-coil DUF342 family protein
MSNDAIPEPLDEHWTHDQLSLAYQILHTRFLTAQTARPFQLERQLHNAHNRRLTLEHEITHLQTYNEMYDSGFRARLQSFKHDIHALDTRERETQKTLFQTLTANEQIIARIKELHVEIADLQTSNQNLKKPLEFYHDAIADASRMQQKNKQLTKEVDGLREQIQDFENAVEGYEATIDGLEMEAEDGKREYRKLQREMDVVIDQLIQVRKDLFQAKRELDRVRDENGCKRKCEKMEGKLEMLRNKIVGFGKLSAEDLRIVDEVAGLVGGGGI